MIDGLTRRDFLGILGAGSGWRASSPRKGPPDGGLGATITALIQGAGPADVAVAYHDLATGLEVLIGADATFHAASTMKVPVLMEVYRQAEEKTLSLDERITVKNEFASLVDGSPFTLRVEDDSEA